MCSHLIRTMTRSRLTCLCLLSWAAVTSAAGNGAAVVKVVVKEDSDAVLNCSFSSGSIEQKLFDWKKDGEKEVFMYNKGVIYGMDSQTQDRQFSGRVFHFPKRLKSGDASVVIRSAEVRDSGTYTCLFPRDDHERPYATIELVVENILKDRREEKIPGTSPKPHIWTVEGTNNRELLQCDVDGAFPKPDVQWLDSSGGRLDSVETKSIIEDNRFYVTVQANVTKTDTYSCVATQEEIYHQIHSKSFVSLPETTEPIITTLHTEDGLMLQCLIRGVSPRTKVEWQDASGNILPARDPQLTDRGGSFDIKLLAAVTKTDNFRCVVTLEDGSHLVSADLYLPDDKSSKVVVGVVVGAVVGIIGTLVVVAVVGAVVLFKLKCRPESSHKDTNGINQEQRHGADDQSRNRLVEDPARTSGSGV